MLTIQSAILVKMDFTDKVVQVIAQHTVSLVQADQYVMLALLAILEEHVRTNARRAVCLV